MPTIIRTNFRPSVHGFQFSNEFQNHFVDVGPVKFTTQGRCGGMAALALDYYFAGVRVPQVRFVEQGLGPYSGPALCRWPDGTAHAFVVRSDGSTATKRSTDLTAGGGAGAWDDWEALTRDVVLAEPAACSWGQGRIDLFAPNGKSVSHLWCERGYWHNDGRPCRVLSFGEAMAGSDGMTGVAAASPGANRIELFGTRDGRLFNCRFDNGWVYGDASSRWFDLGMPGGMSLTSAPAAASDASGVTRVVARAKDNAVWQIKVLPGGGLPEWRPLGGVAVSPPALASPSAGRFEAYVVGTDAQMHTNVCQGDNWSGWSPLGAPAPGLTANRPAALSAPGFMDVYATGKDNLLWHRQFSGGRWNNWAPADRKPTAEADLLASTVYARLMQNTLDPLIRAGTAALAAGPLGGVIGYAGLGSNQKNIAWLAESADTCWRYSWEGELPRILHILGQGKPVIIGLIAASGAVGHQVVAWGADVDVKDPVGPGSLPGPYTHLYVYDNELPGCDHTTLKFDPARRQIIQTPGGCPWKGVFGRDDYVPQPPPRL